MSDGLQPTPQSSDNQADREQRRWRLLFQRSTEPLFLINQQRRILSVNRACEACLGLEAKVVRGLICSVRGGAAAPAGWPALAVVLCPPAEVLEGKPGRVRRPMVRPGQPREWWDIDYFPLRDRKGRLRILGKISCAVVEERSSDVPLPRTLAELRERLDAEFSLDSLASDLPAFRRIVNQIRLAGQCRTPVLVVGEADTGKEWLARVIHQQGPNRGRQFATLDCAALSPPIAGAILFGQGGLLATAVIGTVFLRELEHLARELQDRLNEWLESAWAERPRIIASCCGDPVKLVRAGQLLESLHCTLGALVIEMPPLRDRLADVRHLAARMLRRIQAVGEPTLATLSPAALDVLQAYTWPGNLRELHAILDRAQAQVRGNRLEVHDLPLTLRMVSGLETPSRTAQRPLALDKILEQVERRLIALALRRSKGNKSRAAEQLSIWRARLLRRMAAFGMNGPESASSR